MGNGTEYPDPCEAGEYELAHSSKTDSFDISTSFDGGWFSAFNTPLDMYFIEDKDEKTLKKNCKSFVNDGECDSAFNNFDYEFDGGDCCAATCNFPETCGIGKLIQAFGGKNSGDGFRKCEDPKMGDVKVRLDTFAFQEIPEWARDVYSNQTEWNAFWKPLLVLECDEKMVFSVNLNESMINKNEIANVKHETDCNMIVGNFGSIWYTKYTVIEKEATVNVLRQDRNSIPKEIGELTSLAILDLCKCS